MDALLFDVYDEEGRVKIEALQWKFGQELPALGLTVIIEWGTWEGPSGIPCGSGPELLALPLDYILLLRLRKYSSVGFNAGACRIHRLKRDALSRWPLDVSSTDTRGDGTLRQASDCKSSFRFKLTYTCFASCCFGSCCFGSYLTGMKLHSSLMRPFD
jgi:hypothetical protein